MKDTAVTGIPVALQTPIGEVVKQWRLHRGLKPSELAEKSDLSRSYISTLEQNRINRPSDEHIAKLAEALAIDVWLIIARQLPPQTEGVEVVHEGGERANASGTRAHLPVRSSATKAKPTLGAEIERRIISADLTEQEVKIIAERLVAVTDEMLGLVRATRDTTRASFHHAKDQMILEPP